MFKFDLETSERMFETTRNNQKHQFLVSCNHATIRITQKCQEFLNSDRCYSNRNQSSTKKELIIVLQSFLGK